MVDAPPHAILLAGPHGAGKTTVAPALLRDYLGIVEFINADTIAVGLSAYRPESAALHAGSLLLRRIDAMVALRRSFAFETTLASKTYAPRITAWQAAGYRVDLHFLWLPAVELAIARVATRVRSGGHDIPDSTIRRRYGRGLRNFKFRYLGAVNRWFIYNAAVPDGPLRIAYGSDADLRIDDWPNWIALVETMS